MGKLIGERTDGKYGIKVFGNSALGSEKDTIEQTKIGALDMVRVNIAPFNNIVPETMVPSMPFLFRRRRTCARCSTARSATRSWPPARAQGFIGLASTTAARARSTAKKAVKTLADVKGMKIRVQQSDLWVAMLRAMGANATPHALWPRSTPR